MFSFVFSRLCLSLCFFFSESQKSHLSSFTMKLMKFHSPKIKRTPSKKGKQLQVEPTMKTPEKPVNKVEQLYTTLQHTLVIQIYTNLFTHTLDKLYTILQNYTHTHSLHSTHTLSLLKCTIQLYTHTTHLHSLHEIYSTSTQLHTHSTLRTLQHASTQFYTLFFYSHNYTFLTTLYTHFYTHTHS